MHFSRLDEQGNTGSHDKDVRVDAARATLYLYRAMDFLEENKEAIEKAIYFRLADLLNLDVEIIFYDTTSLHFEIDDPDQGDGPSDEVRGSKAAGGRTYQALRKRGYAKNGRFDAPQIVVGLAVTRDCFPVRHCIHAHVAITVVSLLLERMAEQACGDTWRNIRDDLKQIKLAQLSSPHGTVWQVTEPASGALKRLKSLGISKPAPILQLA